MIHLVLSYNKMITEKGIFILTNLTSLDLSYNDKIENKDYWFDKLNIKNDLW